MFMRMGSKGGSYFHSFDCVSEEELVKWFGIINCDGPQGSTNGATYQCWMLSDPDHDELIMNAMTYSWWLQIKSVLKLNNNYESKQKDHPEYDPSSKYDYVFKVLVHNMANITKKPMTTYALIKQHGLIWDMVVLHLYVSMENQELTKAGKLQ